MKVREKDTKKGVMDSPLTQEPLKRGGCRSSPVTCSRSNLSPLTLGPSSGGDNSTMEKTIRPSTAQITSRAIKMPRQFLWFGVEATSSCGHKTHTRTLLKRLCCLSIAQRRPGMATQSHTQKTHSLPKFNFFRPIGYSKCSALLYLRHFSLESPL